MSLFQGLLADVNKYFVVGVILDSNSRGYGATAGPTTLAGTCYEWDDGGGALVELTTADVSTANDGSAWKQFALDHNARTGQKVVFVIGGVDGSSFYTNVAGGATNNWQPSPTGVCYEPFVAQMANCLEFLGKVKPDLIAGIGGINDEQGSVSTANFIIGVESLFDRLDADYPGVQKLWTQIGRWFTSANSATLYDKRAAFISVIEDYPEHAMCANAFTYVFTTGYIADNVHYSTNSLNALGASYAKYLALTDIPNKWARGVIASLFSVPTSGRRAALIDFVTTLYTEGDYFNMESCGFFKADVQNNFSVDVLFMGATTLISGAAFSANNYVRLDGINDAIGVGITPSFYDRGMSQDDGFYIVKCLTNRDIATTAAALFGGGNSSAPFIGIAQNGSSQINFRFNDNTVTVYTGITRFANDTFYGAARNGGTKYFLIGATEFQPTAVASTGVSARDVPIGAFNTAGALSAFIDADITFYMSGKYTTTNLSLHLTKAQAVLDNP